MGNKLMVNHLKSKQRVIIHAMICDVPSVPKESKWRNILKKYGFIEEIQNRMEEDGWDDMDTWPEIDESVMNELGFKSGHKAKFKKMIRKLFPDEKEPEPEPEPEPQGVNLCINIYI